MTVGEIAIQADYSQTNMFTHIVKVYHFSNVINILTVRCGWLQEVETEQYYNFFLPELKEQGYDGFFSPKSRARTMSESDRKHVDGCAIFYKTEKYVMMTSCSNGESSTVFTPGIKCG